MKSITLAAALVSGLAFATAANATPIMYSFSASGIGATGFFTFDAATDQESAISITVSGRGGSDGVYTQVGPITPPPTTPIFGTPATDIIVGTNGANEAWIGFAAPLGPSGGTIFVSGVGREQNEGARGSAVAVPEPASFAVLGVGIVGLGQRRVRLPATPT
jgi:PEP-CTERM motif